MAARGQAGPENTPQNDEDEDDEESDEDSDSYDGLEGDPDDQEKQHFLDVCWSLLDYHRDAAYDLQKMTEQINCLSPGDAKICHPDTIAPETLNHVKKRVKVNATFLNLLPSPEVCAMDLGRDGYNLVKEMPDNHRVASRNSSKVRSTLRQFVRDWADEGKAERDASYGPLIDAVMRYLPPPPQDGGKGKGGYGGKKGKVQPAPTVLCPGSGLGRLPFELVLRGYAAQGNEFSYHMLLGSHLILNRCSRPKCHVIYPFVLSTGNRRGKDDQLTEIRIPDVAPCQVLNMDSQLSMAAGEFIQVYQDQVGEWDALLSCFFLDTAKNIFLYIRTIAEIIKTGGYFINLGPLLYHYAEMAQEISIELSWEEVKPAIEEYFEIVEEKRHVAQYTTNPNSLMGVKYNCIFFVARRNAKKVSGKSNPVF